MLNFLPKKSRWKFVLSHAATGGAVSLLMELLGATYIAGIAAGLVVLSFGEYKEEVGKRKERGVFVNNLDQNLDAFIDANDDKWQLWQSVGAMAVYVIVRLMLKFVFGI